MLSRATRGFNSRGPAQGSVLGSLAWQGQSCTEPQTCEAGHADSFLPPEAPQRNLCGCSLYPLTLIFLPLRDSLSGVSRSGGSRALWGTSLCLGPIKFAPERRLRNGRPVAPSIPLSLSSLHPHSLSRTGLKAGCLWTEVLETLPLPHCPPGVSPFCPGGPGVNPFSSWDWHSPTGASCPVQGGCWDGCGPGWASVSKHLPGSCRNFP